MNTTVADYVPSASNGIDLFSLGLATSMTNTILSIPLNGYIIWLILGASRETIASDFLSLNLALSEFLYALSSIWFTLLVNIHYQLVLPVFLFFLGFLFTARPLFQCCMCVEYYIGVIHPVLYLRFKPLTYRVACCCVLWLFNLLSCTCALYIFEELVYLYGYFTQNFLFFFVMLFCCLSVLRALKRPGPGDGETGKRTSNSMKRRAFKIMLVITVSMSVNFFLYIVIIPLQCCISEDLFFTIFCCLMCVALLIGLIQPILYLHRSGKLPSLSKVKSPQST